MPGRVAMSWLCFALAALPVLGAHAAPPFRWPEGRRAAASLAYDDALDSQLDIAIPALDRHGFKGSFYVPLANPPIATRLADWRAAARNGHELGNHTLFHQCSGAGADRDWVPPERDLDTTTAAQMRDQVRLANTMLDAIDGAGPRRTLTLPCGESKASDGDYAALVKNGFVAIKVGGGAVTPDMATLDPAAVPVGAPAGLTGKQLIAMVEDAGRRGTMVNFTFHGVGGDYLTTSAQAHEELLDYLARHRDRYWVDTFLNVMTYVRQQRPPAAAP
ncbi:polysaccharide deacetylase family protein [Lysobacter soli]|uniref:polysaccharide deacetylase family protein n=1 Tax=Lysobacter soli TaxID=453783 RepID=UPI0012ECD9AC|nr:polysaccharide deacetylase family protein [Lysobacter soli]QGW65018.1 polysaccharide deacetylase family protein [Lysobacter soli]